ncbi:MAG: class I SAM-dependent methyltransferase [bacterium]|nr:class I SAM-dependent methyltransferase [bacterium]
MFSTPSDIVKKFELEPHMKVADIGAGSGEYSFAAARMALNGMVFAVDVQKELLARIDSEAKAKHLSNIKIVWGNAEERNGIKLADGSIDACIAANILFQVENREVFAEEICRIIRPRGKLLVVDWNSSFGGTGPKPQDIVPKTLAREIFEKAGFFVEREIPAGEYHYGLVFRKK